MMSEGPRGWLCAALLVLAALGTCLGEPVTITPAATPTTIASPNITQTTVPTKAGTNTTAAPTTSSTSSTNATSTAPAPPPTSPTTKVTTAASTSSSTTVTTKETVKPTTQSSTTSTTATPENSTIASASQKISGFDLGSFIGGIVLTLGILAVAYFGCRFYNSRRGVRYRTIDEHEAII